MTTPRSGLQISSIGDRSNRKRTVEAEDDRKLKETTELVLADLMEDSEFFHENSQRQVPRYQTEEVKLGLEIGAGEFGVVFSIAQFCLGGGGCYSCKVKDDTALSKGKNQEKLPRSILVPLRQAGQVEPSVDGNNTDRQRQSVSFAEDTKDSHTLITADTVKSCQEINEMMTADDGSLTDDENASDCGGEEGVVDREKIASSCCRNGTARYAVKRLRDTLDTQTRTEAMLDLACEARYLQGICHPNVVRLRATIGIPGTSSFCIIMDRLVSTLDVKMSQWRTERRAYRGALGFFRRDTKALEALYLERLWVCFDLARAMRYMHSHHLLYRDIKPENIGFNVRGVVQMFDLGLVKELKKKDLVQAPDGYDATGLTGTRRYMPPEVVRCLPYGFSADVFSYSILFWEIFSLKTAFPKHDTRQHYDDVVAKGKRPSRLPSSVLPHCLHDMMADGWSEEATQRPSFKQICELLQAEIVQVQGKAGSASVAERSAHLMNRSYLSLRRFERE